MAIIICGNHICIANENAIPCMHFGMGDKKRQDTNLLMLLDTDITINEEFWPKLMDNDWYTNSWTFLRILWKLTVTGPNEYCAALLFFTLVTMGQPQNPPLRTHPNIFFKYKQMIQKWNGEITLIFHLIHEAKGPNVSQSILPNYYTIESTNCKHAA